MSVRSAVRPVLRLLRLERFAQSLAKSARTARAAARSRLPLIRRSVRSVGDLPTLWKDGVAYRRALAHPIQLDVVAGAPLESDLVIVVCLWHRPERIEQILTIVAGQHTGRRLRLVLWNNEQRLDSFYREKLGEQGVSGALGSVEFYTSHRNLGGIGRFIAMRELERRGYSGPFIMIDDDQDFGLDLVATLLSASRPHAVAGVWAWNNTGAYWDRTQVTVSGEPAMHVGTGGSICDVAIVRDPAFFTRLPLRYLFMEDMWMSRYALRNGWPLTMVESPFTFVLSERDQGHALFNDKPRFYEWLKVDGHVPVAPVASAGTTA